MFGKVVAEKKAWRQNLNTIRASTQVLYPSLVALGHWKNEAIPNILIIQHSAATFIYNRPLSVA